MSKEIDYLTEDEVINNKLYVCMSFLSPEGIKNCSVRGLKIRGVYKTQEEANKRGLPFIRGGAKLIVSRAIKKSRRLLKKYGSA